MSDFKQQVEKIQACNDWRHCGVKGKTCYECRIDRILAAHNAELDRIAERMPETEFSTEKPKTNQQIIRKIAQLDYKVECQAYIQAQKGS